MANILYTFSSFYEICDEIISECSVTIFSLKKSKLIHLIASYKSKQILQNFNKDKVVERKEYFLY